MAVFKRFSMSKKVIVILSILICNFFHSSGQKKYVSNKELEDVITLESVDPLEKIFKETAFFDHADPVADVARGETAGFQFVIRSTRNIEKLTASVNQISPENPFMQANAKIGFVGFTRIGRLLPNPPANKLYSVSGYYPDPILDVDKITLKSFTTQPIWISIHIPKDISPGQYEGLVTIRGIVEGIPFSLSRKIAVKVYNVTIEKTSLWVTNWFAMGKSQLKQISGGVDSVEFQGNYWKWLRVAAEKMKAYHQNVIMTPLFSTIAVKMNNDNFSFDFSVFDRFVQTFIDAGTLERIEGSHLGGRMGNWYAQFGILAPYLLRDTVRFKNVPVTDSGAQNFYRQFLPALVMHLKEKKWDNIYIQHICDEPEPGNEQSYAQISGFVRNLMPGIKIIDAVHSHGVNNTVDIWVPQLDYLDSNYIFYKQRKDLGDELWFYTCLAPQGEYANRYIELPLIKTRILHWINYKYGATGYLHWGWNFWSVNPFEESSGIIPEAGNIMPGGDAFITYPAKGEILSSIRLEAMRDGIFDYELLQMLAKNNPAAANEICRQVVYGFAKYDTDIKGFREKRKVILTLLSE